MPIVSLPISGPINRNRSEDVDLQVSMNLYPDVDPIDGQRYMRNTPGNQFIKTIDTGSAVHTGRAGGMRVFNGVLYAVWGDSFYRIDSNLNENLIGTINTDSGPVGIESNGSQIILVDGVEGWIYDIVGATFSQITSGDFPSSPGTVTFQDTYFIVTLQNTQEFQLSAPGNGLIWDVQNKGIAESEPDTLIAAIDVHRRLLLIGETSTETWYDAGAPDFPFRRDNNLLFEYGIAAPASLAKGHDSAGKGAVFWLSQDVDGVGSVMMSTGDTPLEISNSAIDFLLQQAAKDFDISDAVGIAYKEDGHLFYVLTSRNANLTLCYDTVTRMWHQRTDHNFNYFPMISHAFFNNRHYYQSYDNTDLYELSLDFPDDNGQTLPKERVFRPDMKKVGMRNIIIPQIELYFQSGEGVSARRALVQPQPPATLGGDPKVFLSISRDGGRCFGNQHIASIGKIGERQFRTRFRQLGRCQANRLVLKIEMADPVNYFLIGGQMHYEALSA